MDIKENVTVDSMRHFETVYVCGAPQFKDEILEMAEKLTLGGYVVLTTFLFNKKFWHIKQEMEALARDKVDKSHFLYVVNPFGYVDELTLKTIKYAKLTNKNIIYTNLTGGEYNV